VRCEEYCKLHTLPHSQGVHYFPNIVPFYGAPINIILLTFLPPPLKKARLFLHITYFHTHVDNQQVFLLFCRYYVQIFKRGLKLMCDFSQKNKPTSWRTLVRCDFHSTNFHETHYHLHNITQGSPMPNFTGICQGMLEVRNGIRWRLLSSLRWFSLHSDFHEHLHIEFHIEFHGNRDRQFSHWRYVTGRPGPHVRRSLLLQKKRLNSKDNRMW
jgi:hypothetical protein